MIPREAAQARPRRTAEILDDAWRIYFAEPLFLLAATVLFYFPASTCLLVLIVQPPGEVGWSRVLLPASTAFMVLLTGISSGVCQEAFHSWAEGYDIGFGECVKAACQRGIHHVASQGLSMLGPIGLLAFAVSPLVPDGLRVAGIILFGLWTIATRPLGLARQPSFAAGKPRFWRAVRYALRTSGQAFDRVLLLLIIRSLLLLFAILNLHLFGRFALWAAEHLGGFDVAFLGVLCSLGNGAYTLALVLLAWSLLSPFMEATNYLFFVDARTRFEGLDLWNRVQDLFIVNVPKEKKQGKGKQVAALLATALFFTAAGVARAGEAPLPAVRAARQELQAIKVEVQAAQPYPGGQRWMGRLENVGRRLEDSVGKSGGFRWFQTAVKEFATRDQAEAVKILDELDSRLALVEDSLSRPAKAPGAAAPSRDDIRGLIPPDKRAGDKRKTRNADNAKDKNDDRKPVEDGDAFGNDMGKPVGPGIVGPTAIGGAANALLFLLIGLGAAALLAGMVYIAYLFFRDRSKTPARQAGKLTPHVDDPFEDPAKQDPTQLWRQADERARAGDYLGAVRTLYLAVLALLHQGGFIRYERTRTNGEYVDQLRSRETLRGPFRGLTGLFEVKWYGERACASDDYHRCRELAEEIRGSSVVG